MKKHFFYLAAGAFALTACTSEDVIDDVQTTRNPIQFENVVNKMTRATDLNTSNFKQFNVFGFYTVPGNGTQYPVEPGEYFLIADNA
ncbi:MAG: fimbrillin family protein, partial [Muribaculaceae bacterium]|nr:fimbrillin family protein [Muribaculaceae bacterium]